MQDGGDLAMPLFDSLQLFSDATPRGGAEQMALDEALLEIASRPVLRVYCWEGPAVSFGYSQSLAEAGRAFPGLPLVRRWTGGGLVEHGRDWTFALIVPVGEPFAAVRPAESYRRIHAAVAGALGGSAFLKCGSESAPGGACFQRPVCDDVMESGGNKICGGAQRRTRKGFLHQGSVQGCAWPEDMDARLAGLLAERVEPYRVDEGIFTRAGELARVKYGAPEWLRKIP
jgi:lipoate-protein ligase A